MLDHLRVYDGMFFWTQGGSVLWQSVDGSKPPDRIVVSPSKIHDLFVDKNSVLAGADGAVARFDR